MSSHNEDTTATYDAVASSYLENTRDRGLDFDWLRSFAEGLVDQARVLDLGSGPGRDALDLRRMNLNTICVDRSLGMLRAGLAEYPNPRVLADMLAIPFRSSTISGVWANASLLHLASEELDQGLDEISRVLTPGGKLHVSVKAGVGSSWESERYGKPRWFQYWSESGFDRMLESSGFQIVRSASEKNSRNIWLVRQCVAA